MTLRGAILLAVAAAVCVVATLTGESSADFTGSGTTAVETLAVTPTGEATAPARVDDDAAALTPRTQRSAERQAKYALSNQHWEAAEKYRTGGADGRVDPEAALREYRLAAEVGAGPGAAAALATLARMYEVGWDGHSDLQQLPEAEAVTGLSWSARLLRALSLTGQSYDAAAHARDPDSLLIRSDMHQAVRLYNASAQLGNATAQYTMGVLYAHGLFGVPYSEPLALLHLYFAAVGGSVGAQMALGYRHEKGVGVPKSCPAAVLYMEQAAAAAAAAVESALGLLPSPPAGHRERLSEELLEALPLDGSKGDNAAVSYYQNAADRGEINAHVALGHMYMMGLRGVTQSFTAASEHFHAAAAAGEMLSQANLGLMYLHGLGVERDPVMAAAFLKEPVDSGIATALNTLGYMYAHGYGVPQDKAEAYALFKRAASGGLTEAMYNVALMLITGDAPGGRDFRAAVDNLKMCAAQGHVPALVRLASMQAQGLGTIRDCSGALHNLRHALHRGPVSYALQNGYRLLAAGHPAGALLEYARAAEEGFEVGAWNAAFMLDESLAPGAAVDGSEEDEAGAGSSGGGSGSNHSSGPRAATGGVQQLPDEASSNALVPSTSAAAAQASAGEAVAAGGDAAGGAAAAAAAAAASAAVGQRHQGQTAAPAAAGTASERRTAAGAEEVLEADDSVAGILGTAATNARLLVRDLARLAYHHPTPAEQKRALRLFMRAAAHANGLADLAVGDYTYYGMAGLNASAEAAAEHYRSACNHHIPQACFNLGWMYETGTGIPRDLHLAKRYYDHTAEEQKLARQVAPLPVRVMLGRMWLRDRLHHLRHSLLQPAAALLGLEEQLQTVSDLLGLEPVAGAGVPAGAPPAAAGKAVAPPSHTQSPTPAPAPSAPAKPVDPKQRVKEAIEKAKEARHARQRAESVVGSVLAGLVDGCAAIAQAVTQATLAVMSPIAGVLGLRSGEELTESEALVLLMALAALLSFAARTMRARRLQLQQDQ